MAEPVVSGFWLGNFGYSPCEASEGIQELYPKHRRVDFGQGCPESRGGDAIGWLTTGVQMSDTNYTHRNTETGIASDDILVAIL